MTNHLAIKREDYLEKVLHTYRYMKIHNNMRLKFDFVYSRINNNIYKKYDLFGFYRDTKEDILPNRTEIRGYKVSIYMFVDTGISGDKSARHS